MRFKYNAKNEQGELQTGVVESSSKEAALNVLKNHNLFVLSIESVQGSSWLDKATSFFGRVKIKDLMIFTRQFAILLESKVPIGESLRNLYKQTKKPILKEAILQVSEDVDAGLSLSQALERRGNVFSEFYVNMIRPAEITGRVEEAMSFLADHLEKESIWISKVRNALLYPAIIVILFFVVAGVVVFYIFPQIAPIFEESGADVPFITKMFLGIGSFAADWWVVILLIVVLTAIMIIDYLKSDEGKLVASELKLRLPIFGNLYTKIYVARFGESVSVLLRGGLPLTQSIEIAGHSIQNIVYQEVFNEIAEGVRRGDLFSSLLAEREDRFPALVGQLVSIGEGAGRIDEVLSKVSKIYSREVDDILDNLTELIQPILMIVIGIFVGLLFASVLLPIYNLAKTF